ncbi:molybdopterin-dependent oxidoreductase [Reyranella sp. CPCC 100927]|uniref:molybdopterin-containing oxidoreductase family protein n=1 Tax=Reyranella sp. CPCC 100927 TaxID=2599616 RepID=UPI0011B3AFF7|nr:molybdopterin-dependent oxidoreductase [Reyranella sp. CPCC 100927]TWT14939.1 molybdopterin-dependent oxidoreductase [Reyranella sp. CPCC 100927]
MSETRTPTFCPLCRSRCGAIAVVRDEKLVALEADPSHPTGEALCIKGKAAPEIVANPNRLLHPLIRTAPKDAADPQWRRASWDEALALVAGKLSQIARTHGAEAVAFASTSPSGAPISDALVWVERLINRFGSPNCLYATEICNWHKDHAHEFTWGVGIRSPDFDDTGCVLLWGHNPTASWLDHTLGVARARRKRAKVVVVDPRRAGPAIGADAWLRVRPGTDGALALSIAHVMLERGWFDAAFVRQWSNGPLLVRTDTGRFLRMGDLDGSGDARLAAWDRVASRPAPYDPQRGYDADIDTDLLALRGGVTLDGPHGTITCRTAFDLYAAQCRDYPPERAAEICWVPAAEIERTAQLLHESRPVCLYAWTGVGQHTNATQTDRAIAILHMLTGSHDVPGGNFAPTLPAAADMSGRDLMPPAQRAKALGLHERPLGPPARGWVRTDDFCRAVLHGEPYAVAGLVAFGANLAVSHADSRSIVDALKRLDFYVHCDVIMNPTAQFADVVLPVNMPFERDALRIGFDPTQAAARRVQYRHAILPSQGESRSDAWIIFQLAQRLGFGADFWNGDIEAGYAAILAPLGITLDTLRQSPAGIDLPLAPRYRRFAELVDGVPRGFATPTRKAEIYSERLLEHGQSPLPDYVPPMMSPETAGPAYPLVLTSAKRIYFNHSQHRDIAALRRRMPDPLVELHPDTAAARGIVEGDWVRLRTPRGSIRMRVTLDSHLDPRVVSSTYGWWAGNKALGLPPLDPFSEDGANYNLLIGDDRLDPISGSAPHRSYACEVEKDAGSAGVSPAFARSKA